MKESVSMKVEENNSLKVYNDEGNESVIRYTGIFQILTYSMYVITCYMNNSH
jgi:hypothetical protein